MSVSPTLCRTHSGVGHPTLCAPPPFDTGFLNAALVRHGYQRLSHDVVDTARLARRLVRDEVRDRRLATLARFFRSPTTPVHRALEDARATVVVLHGLLERAGTIVCGTSTGRKKPTSGSPRVTTCTGRATRCSSSARHRVCTTPPRGLVE